MNSEKPSFPLKKKLMTLTAVAIIPLACLSIYLIIAFLKYSSSYDEIVSNLTVANSYNLGFKEEMDESLYKLVAGSITFDKIGDDDTLKDPYILIDDLQTEFSKLLRITTDKNSLVWLQSLSRNLDTLRDRVDDIKINLEQGGLYEENIVMLDNNIYILTELIQDDIQYYIYYQTRSMEQLKLQLNSQIRTFITVSITLLVAILLLVISIVINISNNITRPVSELCEVTSQISEGDFSVRTKVQTNDELSVLAHSVDDMSEKLEVMVQKIKEDERKMRYAELRLLQEQINPHFLYNTLDTIVWLIEGDDPDKAVDMVVSLSEFFRIVLSKGKEYISIKEEAQHIKNYLEIQHARYRDILEYEIAIPQELYKYKILKLTLQPLVENSLYHGIKYKRAMGKILVTGELIGDCIVLKVQDTGVGMETEELERLKEEICRPCKETEKGFGLANVNERIRMNFGTEYGMKIDSEKSVGTTVTVTIPAIEIPIVSETEDEK